MPFKRQFKDEYTGSSPENASVVQTLFDLFFVFCFYLFHHVLKINKYFLSQPNNVQFHFSQKQMLVRNMSICQLCHYIVSPSVLRLKNVYFMKTSYPIRTRQVQNFFTETIPEMLECFSCCYTILFLALVCKKAQQQILAIKSSAGQLKTTTVFI